MFTSRFQRWVRGRAESLVEGLARLGVTPNQVTVVGMLGTFAAAALCALGLLLPAGLVLAVVSTFDILDGALARVRQGGGGYGAFLDSTIDRYMEGAVFLGLAVYFLRFGPDGRINAFAAVLALIGSFQVSYARARAQSLGFTCETGLFKRPERVVFVVAGLVLGGAWPWLLAGIVWLLAVVTNFTALQRIHEVWRQSRPQARPEEAASPQVEPDAKPAARAQRDPGTEAS